LTRVVLRRRTLNQERQHEFEAKTALTEQGRAKAREAIAALRYLQRHRSTVVEWSNVTPAGDLDPIREQHERLAEVIEYLNDETVRRQVELVYDVLHSTWIMTRFGDSTFASSEVMIWRACEEGRAVIGRYLRGEPAQESTVMADLRHAYDSGIDNMQREHDEWLQSQRDAEPPDVN
jgi:hypothetical protein